MKASTIVNSSPRRSAGATTKPLRSACIVDSGPEASWSAAMASLVPCHRILFVRREEILVAGSAAH